MKEEGDLEGRCKGHRALGHGGRGKEAKKRNVEQNYNLINKDVNVLDHALFNIRSQP